MCRKVLFILVSPDAYMDGHLQQCRIASIVVSVHLVQLENPLFSLKTSKKYSFVLKCVHLILQQPLHNKYISSPVL